MSEEKKVETVVAAPVEEKMANFVPSTTEPIITMKKLAAAGVQYGHQTRRWNPKMAPFIYGSHNGIYIVDLKKTVVKIEEAYKALKDIVTAGGKVLFVGTKKQVRDIVLEESLRSGSYYINNRWLGGTLTNFRTILGRIRYLKDLEKQEADGTFDILPKKEVSGLRKQKDKLLKNLDGIKEIKRVPQAVIVIDPTLDHNAVSESKKLGIPVFGIVDTNTDPAVVDFAIPGNDDAVGSVRLIVQLLADAVVEAKGGMPIVAYTKDEDFLAKLDKEHARSEMRPSYGSSSQSNSYSSSAPVAKPIPVAIPTPTPAVVVAPAPVAKPAPAVVVTPTPTPVAKPAPAVVVAPTPTPVLNVVKEKTTHSNKPVVEEKIAAKEVVKAPKAVKTEEKK
jgi:small subunit ribosomal protein S2